MKKPQLLSNDDYSLETLDYYNNQWYISIKRDGVRAEITNEGIKNRSLKVLRNVKIQNYFKEIYSLFHEGVILEAEIYADGVPCREMAGVCNSLDKDVPENTKLYIFGVYDKKLNFKKRLDMLFKLDELLPTSNKYKIVEQIEVTSFEDVMRKYNSFLNLGFEGAVLMNGSGKYKEGRITVNQQIGYKLKPHKYTDLEILGVTERFLNTNESHKNELGRSFKRNTVDAKEETGIAACFICKMRDAKPDEKLVGDDKEFGCITTKVTITGDEESRRKIWDVKESYIGKYAVVKSMDYGAKVKLRHPRLIDIKEACEK